MSIRNWFRRLGGVERRATREPIAILPRLAPADWDVPSHGFACRRLFDSSQAPWVVFVAQFEGDPMMEELRLDTIAAIRGERLSLAEAEGLAVATLEARQDADPTFEWTVDKIFRLVSWNYAASLLLSERFRARLHHELASDDLVLCVAGHGSVVASTRAGLEAVQSFGEKALAALPDRLVLSRHLLRMERGVLSLWTERGRDDRRRPRCASEDVGGVVPLLQPSDWQGASSGLYARRLFAPDQDVSVPWVTLAAGADLAPVPPLRLRAMCGPKRSPESLEPGAIETLDLWFNDDPDDEPDVEMIERDGVHRTFWSRLAASLLLDRAWCRRMHEHFDAEVLLVAIPTRSSIYVTIPERLDAVIDLVDRALENLPKREILTDAFFLLRDGAIETMLLRGERSGGVLDFTVIETASEAGIHGGRQRA